MTTGEGGGGGREGGEGGKWRQGGVVGLGVGLGKKEGEEWGEEHLKIQLHIFLGSNL
jgi:hypothetical protein